MGSLKRTSQPTNLPDGITILFLEAHGAYTGHAQCEIYMLFFCSLYTVSRTHK